jgi:hypothetical protein
MEHPYTEFEHLEGGRKYFILRPNGKKYIGTFYAYEYSYLDDDEMETLAEFTTKLLSYFFTIEDEFYDVEYTIINAYKARHNMELRALKKILKKVVNEDFEWK